MQDSKRLQKSGGFIKITILIIIGLVVLKYAYDIDVLNYVIQIWEKYRGPIQNIWQNIINFFKI